MAWSTRNITFIAWSDVLSNPNQMAKQTLQWLVDYYYETIQQLITHLYNVVDLRYESIHAHFHQHNKSTADILTNLRIFIRCQEEQILKKKMWKVSIDRNNFVFFSSMTDILFSRAVPVSKLSSIKLLSK